MRKGRVVIAVAGIPVVPHDNKPKIPNRREHGGPRPDNGPHGPRRTESHSRYRFSCPASAVSTACCPGPINAVSAASTRAAGRPAGTTTNAPRPEASVACTARAIPSAHSGPGSAVHTALGAPPEASAPKNSAPCPYRRQLPTSGTAGGTGASPISCASARACRGGTASCSTSARLPAYRSATARASPNNSASSTGSGETTCARAAKGPE